MDGQTGLKLNDNWEIIPIERFPNDEVWIYSRAGSLLLNKKQYNNDWNGYYKGNPAPESSYLYMIDLDGKNLTRVTHGETFDAFPVFSRDGKKLAFSSNRNNNGTRDTNLFIAEWKD